MSNQVQLNGSCQQVNESFPQPPAEYSSQTGILEVGDGPPGPPWLQTVVSSILADSELSGTSIKKDVFIALVLVLVHEVGFTVRGHPTNSTSLFDVRILRTLTDLSSVDRRVHSYHLPLKLHDCDVLCELCMITVVPSSNIFIVNFHIPDVETFSLSYNIDNYVALDTVNKVSLKFKNLHQLSKSFKEVCSKFRNAVLDSANLNSLHITKMPYEILHTISTYLDHRSFVLFTSTCKLFRNGLYLDEFIWKRLFSVRFKMDSVAGTEDSWRKRFIDKSKGTRPMRSNSCDTLSFNHHIYIMRYPLEYE